MFYRSASSSTYDGHSALPKVEDNIGNVIFPYAVTKYVNELYAGVFTRSYGFRTIGLRYFNVFGERQDLNGTYAAVTPMWIAAMKVTINRDEEKHRDFCFIENVVRANLLPALAKRDATNEVLIVAAGGRITVNEIFLAFRHSLNENRSAHSEAVLDGEFRAEVVRHSQGDIAKPESRSAINHSLILLAESA